MEELTQRVEDHDTPTDGPVYTSCDIVSGGKGVRVDGESAGRLNSQDTCTPPRVTADASVAAVPQLRRDLTDAVRGWLALQRARIARARHPELGEISPYCFYATKLRFRQLAFDIGTNHGQHLEYMLRRGAKVVAVEPQAQLAASLAERFPTATVLQAAVSDEPGEAMLHLFHESDEWASLDAAWGGVAGPPIGYVADFVRSERVLVTTLDHLIDEYGEPVLVKIDTEGFDHRVLRGLSRPIEHILFEVNHARLEEAAEALDRLEQLGRYEYRMVPYQTWNYSDPKRPREILANLAELPDWGNVYARRIR